MRAEMTEAFHEGKIRDLLKISGLKKRAITPISKRSKYLSFNKQYIVGYEREDGSESDFICKIDMFPCI